MNQNYQPYTQSSGSYTAFNYAYYFCHRFNKQPSVLKPARVLFKESILDDIKKELKLVCENRVLTNPTQKKFDETISAYAFEGDELVVYLERSRLIIDAAEELEDDEYVGQSFSRDIKSKGLTAIFFYIEKSEPQLRRLLKNFELFKDDKKNSVNLIVGSPGEGYSLREFHTKLPSKEIDLDLNYGDSFSKKHKTILKRLNEQNDTGLVILNGKPGTGKTTYIKYLTTLIDKRIIFVPPSMAEGITTPSFLPFLLENKNSILVIEDAEKVVGSREANDTNNGVSNILNMTDGVLGDCLNIQIIATLNTVREKIDPALLRKGRLIAEHEFKELPEENVKKLFEQLKIKKEVTKPLTLTEIYNHDEDDTEEEKPKKFIGFQVKGDDAI